MRLIPEVMESTKEQITNVNFKKRKILKGWLENYISSISYDVWTGDYNTSELRLIKRINDMGGSERKFDFKPHTIFIGNEPKKMRIEFCLSFDNIDVFVRCGYRPYTLNGIKIEEKKSNYKYTSLDIIQNRIISESVKINQQFLFGLEPTQLMVHSNMPFTKQFFEFLIKQCDELKLTFCVCFVADEIVTLIINPIQ